jgi:hypothetical protein
MFVLALACCVSPRFASAAHSHQHAALGPHGGAVLEMGADEYHAELVVNEKGNVFTVFILDGQAKREVPIEAPYLNVNLKVGDKPAQYRLLPVRPDGQASGLTACYSIKSESLIRSLHSHDANPRLTVRIGEKSYVARIVHSHDHNEATQR